MHRALLVLVAACGAPQVRAPSHVTGVIEGTVLDAKTGQPLGGIKVAAWPGDAESTHTETNEHGRYRLELAPHTFDVVASYATARAKTRVALAERQVMRLDLRIDHEELLAALREYPPTNCPSSKPGTIIEGHTTSQREVDEIARAVLQRSIDTPGTILDHPGDTPTVVGTDVYFNGRRLTSAALPDRRRFVVRTEAQLQQAADRTNQHASYIRFTRIDSDGSCALVEVGGGVAIPASSNASVCRCSTSEIYEKRDGRWVFVQSTGASCG